MDVLVWDDKSMSVNIDLIDRHHKELLSIVNNLADSIKDNSQKKDIIRIINRLIDFTQYHFSTEEALFDRLNFNDIDVHKKEHTKFIKNIEDFREKINSVEFCILTIAQDMFAYIKDWFLVHVLCCIENTLNCLKKMESNKMQEKNV